MIQVHIYSPLPLVVRIVKMAREQGGIELPVYYQPDARRHLLAFDFPLINTCDEINSVFMDEAMKLVSDWLNVNEPWLEERRNNARKKRHTD